MSHFQKGSVSKGIKKTLVIGGCLFINTALAGGAEPVPAPLEAFPLFPGVSLYGFGGNGWTAIGDAMAPVFGQPQSFTYIDPQIYYHSDDSEYTASVGAGQRWLTERAGILGAYVFGDYNHSDNGNGFWFVSPGVERLGSLLDFSANLYIPVSSQRTNTGLEFADEEGDFSQVTFAGHDQFDMLVNTFDATGWGGDAQIGVRLPFRNSEVYVGGYYFAPKDSDNIGGGSVRLQVPINNYFSALISEAYDSEYHNTFKAGLTLWFGGRHTGYSFSGDLRERLVDPIQRNLIAVAGGSHTGQPIVQDIENTGQTALEMSNISFFVPKAGSDASAVDMAAQGNGTFENPYVGMTQDNVNDANIQNNRNFYIDSGTYNAVYGMNDPDYIVLNNDQLYGRQNDFRQAASGSGRAVINFANGGFEIPDGDVNDSINGLRLTGNLVAGNAGVWIDHDSSAQNLAVTINNTDVRYFGDGIDAVNNATSALSVNITDSLISNNSGGGELANLSGVNAEGGIAAISAEGGVAAINGGTGSLTLNVTGSTIANNNNTLSNNIFFNAVGGLAAVNANDGSMTINVVDSNLSGNAVDANNASVDAVGGLAAENVPESMDNNGVMNINVTHSTLSGNSFTANETNGGSNFANAAGGLAVVNSGVSMDINVNHSNLSGNTVSATANITDGSLYSISAAGGLAIDQSRSAIPDESQVQVTDPTLMVDVNHSNLLGNSVVLTNAGANVAGGLAVINDNFNAAANIDVDFSNISDNSVALDGSGALLIFTDSVGGLAAANAGAMTIDVDHSKLSGNSVTTTASNFAEIQVNAAGGLAVDTFGNEMIVDLDHSSISGNSVSVNTSSGSAEADINAAGGLAINQTPDEVNTLTVNVDHSQLVDNLISVNLTDNAFSFIGAAGGLAVNQIGETLNDSSSADAGDITIDVDHSSISGNSVSVNATTGSDANINAAGGFAVNQEGLQSPIMINIDHSSLSQNVISINLDNASSFIDAAGGLAINQENGGSGGLSTLTVDVDHSSLSRNLISANIADGSTSSIDTAGGLAVRRVVSGFDANDWVSDDSGYATIDVDHSNIFGNSISADVNGSESAITAAGVAVDDLAAQQAIGTELEINVDHSNLSENSVSANVSSDSSSEIGAAGGLAVVVGSAGAQSETDVDHSSDPVPEVSINVSHSSIVKNSVSVDGATQDFENFVSVAGGLAVKNALNEDIHVDHSNIFGNSVNLINMTNDSAGGIAAFNEGAMTIDVDYSHIVNNSVSETLTDEIDGSVTSSTIAPTVGVVGGLAVNNNSGESNMMIDVSHSKIFGNSVNLTNVFAQSAGGIAAFNNGDMTIGVDYSNISKNSVNLASSSIGAAGGIAIVNEGNQVTVDVSNSKISGNSVTDVSDNSEMEARVPVVGGVALDNVDGNSMDVTITHSVITHNSNAGIDAAGANNTVTLDRSIVAWNEGSALIANEGSVIDVTSPVFFNGVVTFDNASSITFQDLTRQPASGQKVFCLFGQCHIVP